MQDFKKALVASVSLLLCAVLFCLVIIEPSMHSEQYSYYDSKARSAMSGNINYIFNGASHLQTGVNVSIIDKKLNCNSYNLSGSAISWCGRVALLKEEIDRNPVETVVIELSYNTFSRYDKIEGDLRVIPRLNTIAKRVQFLFENTNPSSFNTILGYLLSDGKKWWKDTLLGNSNDMEMDYENKGYVYTEPEDLTVQSKDVCEKYNSSSLSLDFKNDNIDDFNEMVRLCKDRNIDIKFIIIPVSDNMIWEFDNWDEFYDKMVSIVENVDGELYDFNLLKSRYVLFNDKESFRDTQHMSKSGAVTFSETYCEIMKKIDSGEDVSNMFYSTYSEMKSDSPYMKIYRSQQ